MQNAKLWMQESNTYKLKATLEVKEHRNPKVFCHLEITQLARELESKHRAQERARKQEIENENE